MLSIPKIWFCIISYDWLSSQGFCSLHLKWLIFKKWHLNHFHVNVTGARGKFKLFQARPVALMHLLQSIITGSIVQITLKAINLLHSISYTWQTYTVFLQISRRKKKKNPDSVATIITSYPHCSEASSPLKPWIQLLRYFFFFLYTIYFNVHFQEIPKKSITPFSGEWEKTHWNQIGKSYTMNKNNKNPKGIIF